MRTFARLFGLACGAVVIAIAARYGFKTSDNDFDGWIWAFTYGAVTTGGLFGHAVALRVWRHDKRIGAVTGIISALALVISLSNSLGAMAGRGNEQQATRIQVAETVRDLRRGLESAESERKGLKFEPTDEAAVTAARTKATAATKTKEEECRYRTQRCRDKETEESAALAALESATKAKVATDRAAKLDSEIATLRQRIEKSGPILEANSQGNALARLFNLPEAKAATLTTYQNLAMAMVIELLIVMSLVVSEVLEHHESGPQPARAATLGEAPQEPQNASVEAMKVEAIAAAEAPAPAIPAPAKPRLIASSAEPVGNVAAIMAEIMEPGRGKVEFEEAYRAYATVCRQRRKRPVLPEDYSDALSRLCRSSGIALKDDGKGVYLLRVKLTLPEAVVENS